MMTRRSFLTGSGGLLLALGLTRCGNSSGAAVAASAENFELTLSDAEWKQRLTPEQYDVLRRAGTERPFTSPLLKEKRLGEFVCAGCGLPLFSSATKYESGTGWPSFWQPLPGGIGTTEDRTFGMVRTGVHCHRCGGHLGHVFEDGPPPTGLRYCMNGVALKFQPKVG